MNPRVPAGNYEVSHISYELNVLGARFKDNPWLYLTWVEHPYQVAMFSAPRLIPAYIEVTWRYSSHTALTLQLLVNDLSSSGS
ncbi:hypothetical protein K7X08_005226 [Anisodus acutangulus]|uniref:Uncharacterized protein n=1 Tax=Anisodus acutangulus TaxID=402998 RepID=A0A9Q1MFF3_9SOLA|nr:hypothetical protein K7X08_005226 [Anisodus acutangulus]